MVTIANSWWGIDAGINISLTIAYLGRLKKWEELLTPEMQKLLIPEEDADDLSVDVEKGIFRDFPHYATSGAMINYERANVLADLTGWSVLQNRELFEKILSP